MASHQRLRTSGLNRFSKLLLGIALGVVLLAAAPLAARSQVSSASSSLFNQCRQVNPTAQSGLVAYFAPGGNAIEVSADQMDGPEGGSAVYLTSSPPEVSSDGKFIRVWFKSIQPNYKQGWIARTFGDNVGSLKMGSNRWRIENCEE